MLDEINALKEDEEKTRLELDKAERAFDHEKAAQLKYGKLETIQRDLEAREAKLIDIQSEGTTSTQRTGCRIRYCRDCS